MKRIATLALLVIAFASWLVAGTTGKLSGTVTDATSGEKLVGVNVIIDGTRIGGATNIDGYFAIINVPPGTYKVRASLLGYNNAAVTNVIVNVDQTTVQNFVLKQTDLQAEEVVIVATRPVVQKDVAASRANITVQEIASLPVTTVSGVIGLQAGIVGLTVRGGASDQTAFMMDGLTMRDERNSTPFTGISLSSVQDIQVQTGGFSAEYGNVRSGIVNVITKEGGTKNYSVSFTGRYSPATAKNFGGSIYAADSYWIRPMIDDAVAWTGTKNGAWNFFQQKEYREFEGWNSIAEKSLKDPDPSKHLTPEAARELFLFQHRKAGDIVKPDWDMDAGFGGPVPFGEQLGNLRFFSSYRQMRSMYVLPLATDSYQDYTGQIKVTSDIQPGSMKLMVSGLIGKQWGTNSTNDGTPGIFQSAGGIANSITSGGTYSDSRLYSDSYWGLSNIKTNQYGAKFTHVLSPQTFYEISVNQFGTKYDSNPGRMRSTDSIYTFGNGYRTDEAPFGFTGIPATGIDGLRMSIGFSGSRDSSQLSAWSSKFDFNSQIDRYNQIKAGFEVTYTDNNVNYGTMDLYLPRNNVQSSWHTFPVRGGIYLIDKIEYEGMNAELGMRADYSDPQGVWYDYAPYDKAFSSEYSLGLDTLLVKRSVDKQLFVSPRLAVAFPVTDDSKLYFNYGHFRQMPTPENLFLIRRASFDQQITRMANPNNPLQKTVQYELGYEQSMFDEYLIRVSGYYKDVTDQPALVNLVSRDTKVSYAVSYPNSYADIRGFEVTVSKNRGDWVTGMLNYTYMASTSGRFGFAYQYENPATQRDYERTHRESDLYQTKSVPQPYARAIIDVFTPADYNPWEWAKPYQILNDWRLNVTASWSNGNYFTWAGGGSIPGVRNNVQYRDNYGTDMRLSKTFKFLNNVNLQFIMDITNLLNIKNFSGSTYGFWGENFNEYMKSLHMEDGIVDGRFGYVNIPGSDKPGDVRKDGAAWTPIVAVANTSSITDAYAEAIYYDAGTKSFVEYRNNTWVGVAQSRIDKINEDKSYIRMPNMPQLLFLNPRHIYYGVKLTFDF